MNNSIINNFAQKINEKEKKSNKVTALSSSVTDSQYPSAKAVYDAINNSYGSFAELQAIINNAQTGDTIFLDKDYKNQGDENYIVIDKNLKIIGNGHIIDGENDGGHTIFIIQRKNINIEVNVTLENICFINGMYHAINWDNVNLTILDCVFANCFEYYDGGALCCDDDVIIKNSTFINNKVESNDWNSRGGAIWIGGNNSVIEDCLFIGNSAKATGYDGLGGAIFVDGSNNQTKIRNCLFVDNSASTNGGGVYSSTQGFKTYNCTFINSTLYNATNVDYLAEHQSLANYVQKSQTNGLLKNDGTVDTTAYSTFDGNYNNLTNKPTIPSASSTVPSADTISGSVGTGTAWARSDHAHPKSSLYAEASHTHSQYLTSHQDITEKEDKSNKVTSISSSSTDTEYPSAKAVYDATFNLDTLDCINENFTLLSLPQIILTYNKLSFNGEETRLLTNYSEGAYVDWGDGTPIETYESTNTLEHDYSDNVQEHTITIYGNILNLYNNSFKNLTGMTSINIPSSVTKLSDYCFYYCTDLTSVTIPSSVTSLGKYCFDNCSSLTSVTIPSSVISLGSNCFSGCSNLTNITIPSSVTSLGMYCFSGCSNLTNITIPSSVTSLGDYCFSSCARLTNITIPSSVTKLSDSCFYYCSSLTNVTIPSSVTSLGKYCFYNCSSLTSVTIPSSVISLGSNCFRNCTNLVDYQLYWETPPVTWNSTLMPNNTGTYFTIPNGTTANYTAKGFPSDKLVERSE